jgi:predicted RNase H-like nuclease (RuvC/YqgF family)
MATMTEIYIPHDAVKAAAKQICGFERDQEVDWREYIGHARAAITAALEAWPGMDVERFMPDSGPYTIHLPLPKGGRDE